MNKTWEEFYKKRGRFYILRHPNFNKVTSKFNLYKVHTILDLGCGSGRHSIELARLGFKVTGMDFSKEAIALARKWAVREKLKVKFIEGNFHQKLPFKDESFDAVLAIDSICYDTSESLNFILDEVKRILKRGGVIFVTLPTQSGNPLVTHLVFSKEEIEALISKNFKIIGKFLDKSKYLCVFGIK